MLAPCCNKASTTFTTPHRGEGKVKVILLDIDDNNKMKIIIIKIMIIIVIIMINNNYHNNDNNDNNFIICLTIYLNISKSKINFLHPPSNLP